MDSVFAIILGLGVRAVVYTAVGERKPHLGAALVGGWEGVVVHHFLDVNHTRKRRNVDVYLGFACRMWIELLVLQSIEHAVILMLWGALSYVLTDMAPDFYYETGLRQTVKRAGKDGRMVVSVAGSCVGNVARFLRLGGRSPTWAADRLRTRRPSGVRTVTVAVALPEDSEASEEPVATIITRAPPSVAGTYPRSILILPPAGSAGPVGFRVPSPLRPSTPSDSSESQGATPQAFIEELEDEATDFIASLPALPVSREASHEPETVPMVLDILVYPPLPPSQPSPTNTAESFDVISRSFPQPEGTYSGLSSEAGDENPWGTEYETAGSSGSEFDSGSDDPSRVEPRDIPDEPTPSPVMPLPPPPVNNMDVDLDMTPMFTHISLHRHTSSLNEIQPPLADVPSIPDGSPIVNDDFVTAVGDEEWIDVESPMAGIHSTGNERPAGEVQAAPLPAETEGEGEVQHIFYNHDSTTPDILSPAPLPMRPWAGPSTLVERAATPLEPLVPLRRQPEMFSDNRTESTTMNVEPYRHEPFTAPLRDHKRGTGLFSPPNSPSPPPSFAQATRDQRAPFMVPPNPTSTNQPSSPGPGGEFVGGFQVPNENGPLPYFVYAEASHGRGRHVSNPPSSAYLTASSLNPPMSHSRANSFGSSTGAPRPLPAVPQPTRDVAPPTPHDDFTEPEDDFHQRYPEQPKYEEHEGQFNLVPPEQPPYSPHYNYDGVDERHMEYPYDDSAHGHSRGPSYDGYAPYPEQGYAAHLHQQPYIYPTQEEFEAQLTADEEEEKEAESDDSEESEMTVSYHDAKSPPPISAAKRMKQKLLERGRNLRVQAGLAGESVEALMAEQAQLLEEGKRAMALMKKGEVEDAARSARVLERKAAKKIWKAHNPNNLEMKNGAAGIRVIGLTPEEALRKTEESLHALGRADGNLGSDLRVTVQGGLADYESDPVNKGNQRREYLHAALTSQQLGVQDSQNDPHTLIVTLPFPL